MLPLVERVRCTIRRYDLVPSGTRVLVALSGGPDSVALLTLLQLLAADLRLHRGRRRTPPSRPARA